MMTFLIAGLILIGFGIMYYNQGTASCEEGHNYDKPNNLCYYRSTACQANQTSIILPEGDYNCTYSPTTLLDNKIFTYLFIFLGTGWFIIFIIFMYNIFKKGEATSVELGTFRKEDFVMADDGFDVWALRLCKDLGIFCRGDLYQKSAIRRIHAGNVYQLGQEWFCKFCAEVTEGIKPGLYTAVISLSRGKKWIAGGMVNWKEGYYEELKNVRSMPWYTPQNQIERTMQQIAEQDPEKAYQLQLQQLQQQMQQPQQQQVHQFDNEQQSFGGGYGGYSPYRRPPYRRPFFRRY